MANKQPRSTLQATVITDPDFRTSQGGNPWVRFKVKSPDGEIFECKAFGDVSRELSSRGLKKDDRLTINAKYKYEDGLDTLYIEYLDALGRQATMSEKDRIALDEEMLAQGRVRARLNVEDPTTGKRKWILTYLSKEDCVQHPRSYQWWHWVDFVVEHVGEKEMFMATRAFIKGNPSAKVMNGDPRRGLQCALSGFPATKWGELKQKLIEEAIFRIDSNADYL